MLLGITSCVGVMYKVIPVAMNITVSINTYCVRRPQKKKGRIELLLCMDVFCKSVFKY